MLLTNDSAYGRFRLWAALSLRYVHCWNMSLVESIRTSMCALELLSSLFLGAYVLVGP